MKFAALTIIASIATCYATPDVGTRSIDTVTFNISDYASHGITSFTIIPNVETPLEGRQIEKRASQGCLSCQHCSINSITKKDNCVTVCCANSAGSSSKAWCLANDFRWSEKC